MSYGARFTKIGWVVLFLIFELGFLKSTSGQTYPQDSDGGRNPAESGTCLEANHALMRDECFDENTLNELFPNPDTPGYCTSELISCSGGCENGVCHVEVREVVKPFLLFL